MVALSLLNALSARYWSRLLQIFGILMLVLMFGTATVHASELELVGKLERKGGWCPSLYNNRVYIGEPGGMRILDVSDPAHVQELGKVPVSGIYVSDIVVSGTLGFIGCTDGSITTFDAANPLAPISIGLSRSIQKINAMKLAGGYLYVDWNYYSQGSGYEGRFATFDARDPSSLTLQSIYPISGRIDHFDVSGGKAYIANRDRGLLILDVSNPTSPTYVSRFDTPDYAYDVAVKGNIAYVADNAEIFFWGEGNGSIQMIDVSQPKNPVFLGDRHLSSGWNAARIAIEGSNMVVMDLGGHFTYGLITLDVTTPTSPTFKGGYPCYSSSDFAYTGKKACLYGATGLEIVDMSNIGKPAQKSIYAGPGGTLVHDIAVDGDSVYTLDKERFCVVDVSNPRKPFVRSTVPCPYPSSDALANKSGMVVRDGYAYIGGYYFGFSIIDVHNPDAPEINNFSIGGCDIAVSNGYAYIADRGIGVYDVRNPKSPNYKGMYRLDGSAESVVAQGSFIYAATSRETAPWSALSVINAMNPASLSLLQTYPLSASPLNWQ